MRKPVLIETAVCLFPDSDFCAATTQTAIKRHATGRLFYSPLRDRENLLSSIINNKGLVLYRSCIEPLEKHVQTEHADMLFPGTREFGILTN